jgi:hypothetical protein
MEHQRKTKPFSSHAVVIEGQLFSSHVPKELRGPLPMPPVGASQDQLERYERAFNRRARYRYQRHAGPDADGVTRWRCPFHSGFLRSRSLPRTMRASRAIPLVDLPKGAACCGGIISASAADLPLRQRLAPGTTAWRVSMGRRQVAEAANAGLKGGFVNIERKFFRIFGRTKLTVLLAFTVAGYNLDRIRSFLARKTEQVGGPRHRAKRRLGTFAQLFGEPRPVSGPDPP